MYLVHKKSKDVFVEILEEIKWGTVVRWWNLSQTGEAFLTGANPSLIQKDENWTVFNPDKPETHPGRRQDV